jgi:small subunit ribosomal protein S21
MQVFVRDNDINSALRVLKKKMQRDGTFREMKRRRAYEKPSERRAREQAESMRRHRKMLRKRLEREGYWPEPGVEHPNDPSSLPADHFRRHAARVRALAHDATTPAIKKRLEEVALDYERIANRFDESGAAQADGLCPGQSEI